MRNRITVVGRAMWERYSQPGYFSNSHNNLHN